MLLRPFLLLYRRRLIWVGICALVLVAAVFFLTVGFSASCGCAPDASDARALLNTCCILCLYTGMAMGFTTGLLLGAGNTAAPAGGPVAVGDTRFLLTRPLPRPRLLLEPLAIAGLAITLIPAAAILLVLGGVAVFRPSALHDLLTVVRFIPGTAQLGLHPSLLDILAAIQFWRLYAAAISVGLCGYAVMSAQRWAQLSRSSRVRKLALLPLLLLFGTPWIMISSDSLRTVVLLLPPRGILSYQPSLLGIALHLAFAAGVMAGCIRLTQRADL